MEFPSISIAFESSPNNVRAPSPKVAQCVCTSRRQQKYAYVFRAPGIKGAMPFLLTPAVSKCGQPYREAYRILGFSMFILLHNVAVASAKCVRTAGVSQASRPTVVLIRVIPKDIRVFDGAFPRFVYAVPRLQLCFETLDWSNHRKKFVVVGSLVCRPSRR